MVGKNILDYDKVIEYDSMFQRWKNELFPKEEYKYLNQDCAAFRTIFSEKALSEGFSPQFIMCTDSHMTNDFFETYKNRGLTRDTEVLYAEVTMEKDNVNKYHMWGMYHMAMIIDLPIYKNSNKKENIIFDPCLFASPVTEKEWRDNMNAMDDKTEISSYKDVKDGVIRDFGKDISLELAKKTIAKMKLGDAIILKSSTLVEKAAKQKNIEKLMTDVLNNKLIK